MSERMALASKIVLSVSLGSSSRDMRIETVIGGTHFVIIRRGTNGSIPEARRIIQEADGKVDVICLGGIDRWLRIGKRVYEIRDARKLALVAKITPVVDGSGLKDTLERLAIYWLEVNRIVQFRDTKVLLMSGLDRFGLAEELVIRKARVVFGDMVFALGIPMPIRSMFFLELLARLLLPIVTRVPFTWLYPTGKQQESFVERGWELYDQAEWITGDFLYIRRYLPPWIGGKTVLTNTIRPADIELLRSRGCRRVITTTPLFLDEQRNQFSFGTNVLEGAVLALLGQHHATRYQYLEMIKKLGWVPQVINL